jgi:hypothetical protein
MPNAGVKYGPFTLPSPSLPREADVQLTGPSFWLVVGALSIFGCAVLCAPTAAYADVRIGCFFAILYTAFVSRLSEDVCL